MTKNVGIWVRVSTEDQAKGESPKHHEERARMFAKLQNWNVKEVYNLAGVSGKTVMGHPEAQRMLFDIKNQHISGIIFSKIARLARNTRELLEFSEYFRSYEASLISLEESFDTATPAGRLFFTFISAIAEWEREEITSRIKSSMKVRAKLGKRLGGKVPFGYTWDGHELHIQPEEAAIRKLMFDLFIQEKRKKTVARILNERGYRTRSGKKFYDTNVKRWIRDPLSKGLRRSNHTKKVTIDGKEHTQEKPEDEWFFHKAPAIVSEEVWQQANDILDEQEKNRTKPLNRRTHIFTRYIWCECGSRMNVRSGNKYYRCSKKGCGSKIEREQFEAIYKEQLITYVSSEKKVREYLKLSNTSLQEKEAVFNATTSKRDELKKEIKNILDLHSKGQIPTEAFKEYHEAPYQQLQQLNDELPKIEAEIRALKIQQESIHVVMDDAINLYNNWDQFTQDQKRRIVEMITEKITIGLDDNIHIKLFRLLPEKLPHEMLTNGQPNLHL